MTLSDLSQLHSFFSNMHDAGVPLGLRDTMLLAGRDQEPMGTKVRPRVSRVDSQ